MDSIRIGRSCRALRLRRQLRQIDVATRAGISRGTISNIERAHLSRVAIGTLVDVAAALGADVDLRIRWHGADLDRLLDEGHARLVDAIVALLTAAGWDAVVEATFSIFGERGSIDVLAFHPAARQVLVVEAKTVVPDFQAMVAALDRKTRLASTVAAERGWSAIGVSRLLVVEDGSTPRGRIERVGRAAAVAFPVRGIAVRRWLREPIQPMSGLLFLRTANGSSTTLAIAGRQRIRNVPGRRRDPNRN